MGPGTAKKIFTFFFLWLAFSSAVYAVDREVLESEEVVVFYDSSLGGAARETLGLFPHVRRELEEILPFTLDFIPTVILLRDEAPLDRTARADPVVAFAVPERRLMVVRYERMRYHPFSIKATLKHELSHLMLHDRIPRERLPKWLDEGVAQWVSGGFTEILVDKRDLRFHEALISGRYIPLGRLESGFPEEIGELMLAYEESLNLIEYMAGRFGVSGVRTVLDRLAGGDRIDDALQKGLGISLQTLESEWIQDQSKKRTWFIYLIRHLYEILFFLGAVILIIAFLKRVARKKAEYEDED